ncbi:carboxymuconolactone decarboxylase family protein [Puia dinghuensis]|uniref:Alkyl hydroperoxide reductase AhpD n=1 Tax=Puia dinghuensis TaxID=1792502 RepID=A0A8J2XUA3_9BACT|nr:carboxymuconolactone decarboxylase family protein [Puia dinghuensis]GGB06183.1 alkyl hydroperoxide reductase AhpD [Puia dinghuensis]
MLPFVVPSRDQLAPEAQVLYDQFQQSGGKMPNLYATIGYSANALVTYVQYSRGQAKNTFHVRDREGIFLIVSQLNGCEYCLASHTASALKAGWKEEDTLAIRAGNHPDKKWQVIYAIVRSVIENKGEVADALLRDFSALGYNDAAIMDLFVLINVMSFTNYVYRLIKVPIDYPSAKPV